MENLGKLIQMEILTKQVKLNSLTKLVQSLDSLSNLVDIERLASKVRVERRIVDEIDLGLTARVSKMVLADRGNVTWLYREYENNAADSGWRVYSGEESDSYMEEESNFQEVTLSELIKKDNKLNVLLSAEVGTQFEWFKESVA